MPPPDSVHVPPHASGGAAANAGDPPPSDERPLRLVLNALRGREGDPTSGPLGAAILFLAIPMVLEMAMESVFAVVDIFFVSQLGAASVAAVGLTESLMTIVYTVAMGLSIGVTATVSRRVGEKDPEAAGAATVQAMLLGAAVAAVLGVFGVWQADSLLRLMGAGPDVVAAGVGYTRVLLGLNGVILMLFLLNAAFRGAGDAAIAMRVLWLANGLNIVLDPLLIFGIGPFPEMGVTGAAVATSIGRGVAVCVQIYTLFRLSDRLRITAAHFRVRLGVILRLIRLSATGTFQIFIGMASWVGLVRVIADFGPEALAGYTVAIRIVLFALLPAWGLSNAAATMVGQNMGAGKPERAERSVWLAARFSFAFLGGTGLLFLVFAPQLVGLFGVDDATAAYAVLGLRIVAAGFFFYGHGMTLSAAFNGAGDAWTPTWLNLFCFWLWEVPLAWFLAYPMGWGPSGVFTAVAVAYSTLAVAAAVLFRRGRWKEATV
ncbi:MAG: MATE family efflux transporter [Longimicrobiales bacterium]